MQRQWKKKCFDPGLARQPTDLCGRRKQIGRVRRASVFSTMPAVAKKEVVETSGNLETDGAAKTRPSVVAHCAICFCRRFAFFQAHRIDADSAVRFCPTRIRGRTTLRVNLAIGNSLSGTLGNASNDKAHLCSSGYRCNWIEWMRVEARSRGTGSR
jgi:hypothetical protein